MIYLLGDIHGFFEIFDAIKEKIGEDPNDIIIQVGDFGIWPKWEKEYKWSTLPWKVYFIDGNHEYFPYLPYWDAGNVKQLSSNLFYIPRGTILNLEGKKIGFIGGAESLDQKWRVKGESWFWEERVQEEHVAHLLNEKLDVIVSHSPPLSVQSLLFPPLNKREWGLSMDWSDRSAENLERLYQQNQNTPWYCGHMHESKKWINVQLLAINEVVPLNV